MDSIIDIEPNQLNFSPNSKRVGLTITNNGTDPLDLLLRIRTDGCSDKFKIPYLRGEEIICEKNKSGSIPLSPQEHQLFYVYYEPSSPNASPSNAQLELEYKDQKGHPNIVSVPLIIN